MSPADPGTREPAVHLVDFGESMPDYEHAGPPPEVLDRIAAQFPSVTKVETILDEAQAAVFGPRAMTYGHPRDNFKAIAALWNGWLRGHDVESFDFEAVDVADLMILTKMARLFTTPEHRDSLVDIAGYAETRARVLGVDA